MKRSQADLPEADALLALVADGILRIRVTPGSRSEGIAIEDDRVLVKVRAKPTDGQANLAVEKLLAAALGIQKSRCRIVRGATSREKVVEIAT